MEGPGPGPPRTKHDNVNIGPTADPLIVKDFKERLFQGHYLLNC